MSGKKISVALELLPEVYQKAVRGSKQRGLTIEEWIIDIIQKGDLIRSETLVKFSTIPREGAVKTIQLPAFDTDIPQ